MAALEVSTEGLRDADDVESSDSPATERRQLLQPSGNPQQMKSYSSEERTLSSSQGATDAPRESPDTSDSGEKKECGFVFIFKKCLNLLPKFGDDDDEDQQHSEELLRYGALQIINLLTPVTICMAAVLVFVVSIQLNSTQAVAAYLPFGQENTDNGGLRFGQALLNVAVILALVIVMTIVLVCLFKYKCYRGIYAWLLVSSILLLFFFSSLYLLEVCQKHNLALDWMSLVFYLWNFGSMGIIVIYWKGPLRLQQAYLIVVCAVVATRLLHYLPDWTTWLLLFAISIWDIIAVLCPKGPLRILVETAQERNQEILPALIYSSTMIWMVGMATVSSANKDSDEDSSDNTGPSESSPSNQENGQSNDTQQQEEESERRGVKLGLGDFIFYSLLLGKAAIDSKGDWVIISSCFVAILIGLCMTTVLLGMLRRALPALPISIIFGLIFYFASQHLLSPFAFVMSTNQVFL